eukprot:gene29099-36178_t
MVRVEDMLNQSSRVAAITDLGKRLGLPVDSAMLPTLTAVFDHAIGDDQGMVNGSSWEAAEYGAWRRRRAGYLEQVERAGHHALRLFGYPEMPRRNASANDTDAELTSEGSPDDPERVEGAHGTRVEESSEQDGGQMEGADEEGRDKSVSIKVQEGQESARDEDEAEGSVNSASEAQGVQAEEKSWVERARNQGDGEEGRQAQEAKDRRRDEERKVQGAEEIIQQPEGSGEGVGEEDRHAKGATKESQQLESAGDEVQRVEGATEDGQQVERAEEGGQRTEQAMQQGARKRHQTLDVTKRDSVKNLLLEPKRMQ